MMKIRQLGLQPYAEVWQEMKTFSSERNSETQDEIWFLEHPPVYTQGQAGKTEHVLNPKAIPIVQSDRGGQVTYHGPGQLVVYVLIDLRRRSLGVRDLVCQLEHLILLTLSDYNIIGETHCGAPGVYIKDEKIASVGLRVKNGCTYHGIALNIAMDLEPFLGINPCGFAKMKMTQMSQLEPNLSFEKVNLTMQQHFLKHFHG